MTFSAFQERFFALIFTLCFWTKETLFFSFIRRSKISFSRSISTFLLSFLLFANYCGKKSIEPSTWLILSHVIISPRNRKSQKVSWKTWKFNALKTWKQIKNVGQTNKNLSWARKPERLVRISWFINMSVWQCRHDYWCHFTKKVSLCCRLHGIW